MVTVEQLLMLAKEKKASDVHITVGLPPKVRINGELVNLDYPRLSPEDCQKLIEEIMDDRQWEIFKEEGEADLLAQADAFVDPKLVSVWEIKDGEFLPIEGSKNGTIQDANGLIRGNYFDRVMKGVMGDFSAFLSYYE